MPHYKMSDVVVEINDRENNPSESKYERFVGLEHYVSGEVIIRNFGSTERLESTMKVFQSGDILVARRNVYLKRAATVDFDGLTSGDSIVLRPTNYLIGRILPFVLNTDAFWDFADRYSDGTMSKRLSPKTLMKYEFDLPNDDELSLLADTLWAANDTREAYQELLRQSDELVKSQFIELFGDFVKGDISWPQYKLQELLEMGWITYHLDGNHGGEYPRSDEFVNDGVPYISANCVNDGKIDFANSKYVTLERSKRFRKGIAQNYDVLFAHNATVGPVAILHTTEPTVILGTSLTAYRCDWTHIIPEYLFEYLRCEYFVRQYEAEMQQTTRKQVPITTQRKYTIVVPSLASQKVFVQLFQQSDKSKFELKQAIANITALMKSLMQQDFSN